MRLSILSIAAIALQLSAQPKFEIADVHSRPPNWITGVRTRVAPGRYELRNATMVDLVGIAWNVPADKVVGGPVWVDTDRFDVVAIVPSGTSVEMRRAMLRTLLEERFHLIAHADTRDFPAYALTAGKQVLLEKADATDDGGCSGLPASAPQPRPKPGDTVSIACRGMTMAAVVSALPTMRGASGYLFDYPLVDRTGLAGTWNFTVHWSIRGPGAPESVSLFSAFEKQLGLKLELTSAPMQVVAIESANEKPTPNLPEVTQRLPAPPMEFEAADIKPASPDDPGGSNVVIQPGGRIRMVMTLKGLIQEAWGDFNPDLIIGAPKFTDKARYVVTAKAPSPDMAAGPAVWNGVDIDSMRMMLRGLVVSRFGLTTHNEERLVPGHALAAARPKLVKASPVNHPGCKEGPGADGRDPRISNPMLSRLVTCRNMTMGELAAALPTIGAGYMSDFPPVMNATGIKGRFDMTLSFSPWNAFPRAGTPPPQPSADGSPSEPSGAVSLADALQHQLGLKLEARKVTSTVLVIDHVNEAPTEN